MTWLPIIAIDFLNLFGLQEWTISKEWQLPFLWWEIYREARYTEMLQWLMLATAAGIALMTYVQRKGIKSQPDQLAWLIFSTTLLLMLIEDSLNLRHLVADVHLPYLLGIEQLARSQRTLWELCFYALLATGMTIPLWLLWRDGFRLKSVTASHVFLAYAIYGSVGFGSALRKAGDWQSGLGAWLIEALNLSQMPAWRLALEKMAYWQDTFPGYNHTLGYLLVDHLLEETIEFIAATLLLTAILQLRATTKVAR